MIIHFMLQDHSFLLGDFLYFPFCRFKFFDLIEISLFTEEKTLDSQTSYRLLINDSKSFQFTRMLFSYAFESGLNCDVLRIGWPTNIILYMTCLLAVLTFMISR